MEMDKAINLQMQIKENSEDFKKEMRDMEAWEEQMKKKDLQIRNMKDDQVLPPVRTKKKKKSLAPKTSEDEKPSKTKRISGSDYNSWEKFDADKACEKLEDKTNSKEEKVYEIPSKEQLEKEHAEAIKLKEEGNVLVKKREYAKAVGKYSAAIKVFPGDATFYANRALCQLKLDNLYSAESDCTAAIKLDEHYIKAYHRRASARIELKQYKDAIADLETILKIEPSNKEAACLLMQVQKKLEKTSQPKIISENEKGEKSLIEKQIGEKLFGKKLLLEKDSMTNDVQNKVEKNQAKKTLQKQKQPSCSKDEELIAENVSKERECMITEENSKKTVSNIIKSCNSTKSEKEDSKLPSWLPKLKKDISVIKPLAEAPRRLSQKLRRIHIHEISKDESIFKDIEFESDKFEKQEKTKEPSTDIKEIANIDNNCENVNNDKSENIRTNIECSNKIETDVIENLPSPPKSSVAFLLSWRKNTSSIFRYQYLKQILPEDLPKIFKDSLESSIFSEILSILSTKFVPNNENIYNYLKHLATVKRFRALILFLSQEDKEVLKKLFDYCKTKENRNNEEVQELYSAYEM